MVLTQEIHNHLNEFCQNISKDTKLKVVNAILDGYNSFKPDEGYLKINFMTVSASLKSILLNEFMTFFNKVDDLGFPRKYVESYLLYYVVENNKEFFSYYSITTAPAAAVVRYKNNSIGWTYDLKGCVSAIGLKGYGRQRTY